MNHAIDNSTGCLSGFYWKSRISKEQARTIVMEGNRVLLIYGWLLKMPFIGQFYPLESLATVLEGRFSASGKNTSHRRTSVYSLTAYSEYTAVAVDEHVHLILHRRTSETL